MAEPKEDEGNPFKRFGILSWLLTILLIASTALNLWQKSQLNAYEKELQKCQTQLVTITSVSSHRTKRNAETMEAHSSFYLPLYTQLTPQAIQQLCANRYDIIDSSSSNINNNIATTNYDSSTNNDVIIIPATSSSKTIAPEQKIIKQQQSDKNRTKWKTGLSKNGKRKSYYKVQKSKTCPLISSIHDKQDYGARMYEMGSAIRSDDLWFITEYAMGYMLFEYNTTATATNEIDGLLKIPSNIYTLPMPFSGTDHAIGKHSDGSRIFYYQVSSTNTILGYKVKDDKSVQKEIYFEKKPLYKHSASEIDLEIDEGNLYGIYRDRNNTAFTIIKLHPFTLKQLEKHQIVVHFSDDLVNAFISCHVFYAVRQELPESNLKIEPIFDFQKREYIKFGPSQILPTWKSHGIPANIQFDSISQTLNAFDKGNIYSFSINRQS